MRRKTKTIRVDLKALQRRTERAEFKQAQGEGTGRPWSRLWRGFRSQAMLCREIGELRAENERLRGY